MVHTDTEEILSNDFKFAEWSTTMWIRCDVIPIAGVPFASFNVAHVDISDFVSMYQILLGYFDP